MNSQIFELRNHTMPTHKTVMTYQMFTCTNIYSVPTYQLHCLYIIPKHTDNWPVGPKHVYLT